MSLVFDLPDWLESFRPDDDLYANAYEGTPAGLRALLKTAIAFAFHRWKPDGSEAILQTKSARAAVARRAGIDHWRWSCMSVSPGWVSVSDAARYVKLAPDVITRAIASGELFAVIKPVTRREGGRPQYRVALADVDAWMRSQPSAREAMCGV